MEKLDLRPYVNEAKCIDSINDEITTGDARKEYLLRQIFEESPFAQFCLSCPICGSTALRLLGCTTEPIEPEAIMILVNMRCECGREFGLDISDYLSPKENPAAGPVIFAVDIKIRDYGAFVAGRSKL